jgi:hypothetical protein
MRLREFLIESRLEDYFDDEIVNYLKEIERMLAAQRKDPGFINQEYNPTYIARMKDYIDKFGSERDTEVDELWDWFVLANRLDNWNPGDYFGHPGYNTIKHFLGRGPLVKRHSFHASELSGERIMQHMADVDAKRKADRLINKVSGAKKKSYVDAGQELLKYAHMTDLKDDLKNIANDVINGFLGGARQTFQDVYNSAHVFQENSVEAVDELKKIIDNVLRKHNIYDDFYNLA